MYNNYRVQGALSRLEVQSNKIDKIPDVLCTLTNLKHLNLSNNQIAILPEKMGNLKSLTKMYLIRWLVSALI